MLYIIGPKYPVPEGAEVINTTSRSEESWSRGLSPFYLGPVDLYNGYKALNVENAWQFSKVYYNHVDENDNPTEKYFEWAKKGWESIKAYRYPMGKGMTPLFSYWDGEKFSYTEARKKIYIPLYANAVQKSFAFQKLKKIYAEKKDLYLWDFDGYNNKALGLTYDQVINDPNRKMGHAFVIGMLLEGYFHD